ncbi:hypothetical protein EMIHUDRAFT_217049 [Emiliania huxleyi CCMP1516]|uniref:Uncharacterized protein n=2 Tax=Emiliania huxleyi TaxID=2903 RepID=A0A0D3IC08_EMIH1|nr:hypothetical protein EMIHUDRAFT_217049 [Emiliania huxleyi CCMP1516]EOD08793.1 hypothetical protein EMIHUDRAFT_217049 [Emiliania huxleyi CCMP1516]|eukprot:XP_005761222.1 hypothetical protein EMIHUDRAFT_217049 [Emiliania huxleyi CCMP1516]
MALAERGGVLPRRQDLPEEAFLSSAQLRRIEQGARRGFGCCPIDEPASSASAEHGQRVEDCAGVPTAEVTVSRVVGGDRRIPSYGGEYRYAREDKGVDVRLLLFESFGGFGKGVGEILWEAANVLQNKLTRAHYLDEPEVTWTTKSWLGLQKQRISVVLHTAIAEQIVNELANGEGGRVHGAECLAVLAGVA